MVAVQRLFEGLHRLAQDAAPKHRLLARGSSFITDVAAEQRQEPPSGIREGIEQAATKSGAAPFWRWHV
jgi:hypothetical protein